MPLMSNLFLSILIQCQNPLSEIFLITSGFTDGSTISVFNLIHPKQLNSAFSTVDGITISSKSVLFSNAWASIVFTFGGITSFVIPEQYLNVPSLIVSYDEFSGRFTTPLIMFELKNA